MAGGASGTSGEGLLNPLMQGRVSKIILHLNWYETEPLLRTLDYTSEQMRERILSGFSHWFFDQDRSEFLTSLFRMLAMLVPSLNAEHAEDVSQRLAADLDRMRCYLGPSSVESYITAIRALVSQGAQFIPIKKSKGFSSIKVTNLLRLTVMRENVEKIHPLLPIAGQLPTHFSQSLFNIALLFDHFELAKSFLTPEIHELDAVIRSRDDGSIAIQPGSWPLFTITHIIRSQQTDFVPLAPLLLDYFARGSVATYGLTEESQNDQYSAIDYIIRDTGRDYDSSPVMDYLFERLSLLNNNYFNQTLFSWGEVSKKLLVTAMRYSDGRWCQEKGEIHGLRFLDIFGQLELFPAVVSYVRPECLTARQRRELLAYFNVIFHLSYDQIQAIHVLYHNGFRQFIPESRFDPTFYPFEWNHYHDWNNRGETIALNSDIYALFDACYANSIAEVGALLASGVDINATWIDRSALVYALMGHAFEVASYLMSRPGFDPRVHGSLLMGHLPNSMKHLPQDFDFVGHEAVFHQFFITIGPYCLPEDLLELTAHWRFLPGVQIVRDIHPDALVSDINRLLSFAYSCDQEKVMTTFQRYIKALHDSGFLDPTQFWQIERQAWEEKKLAYPVIGPFDTHLFHGYAVCLYLSENDPRGLQRVLNDHGPMMMAKAAKRSTEEIPQYLLSAAPWLIKHCIGLGKQPLFEFVGAHSFGGEASVALNSCVLKMLMHRGMRCTEADMNWLCAHPYIDTQREDFMRCQSALGPEYLNVKYYFPERMQLVRCFVAASQSIKDPSLKPELVPSEPASVLANALCLARFCRVRFVRESGHPNPTQVVEPYAHDIARYLYS